MLYFNSDYMEGCHPDILKKLEEINFEKITGYGSDDFCASAKEKIKKACGVPDAEVKFLVGGTQANATVIASVLRNYEGVIAADSGHISVHESGAIEATGHKVLTIPAVNGKLCAKAVEQYLERFYADDTYEHMVIPGMVYISHPTETGTLYTRQELEELHTVCQKYSIPLFMDGARMGYGLAGIGTDVTLPIISKNCDVFYIGGTKVGALFGEAVVVTRPALTPHFFTTIKQKGALMAKGWLLGVQFDVLFTDGLYEKIGKNAVDMAMLLKAGLQKKGYCFYADSPTNQQFVILNKNKIEELKGKVSYSNWEDLGDKGMAVRFATSWATTRKQVEALLELL